MPTQLHAPSHAGERQLGAGEPEKNQVNGIAISQAKPSQGANDLLASVVSNPKLV